MKFDNKVSGLFFENVSRGYDSLGMFIIVSLDFLYKYMHVCVCVTHIL